MKFTTNMIAFGFGLIGWCTLSVIIWGALLNGDGVVLYFNLFNELIFEFIWFNSMVIFFIILIIKEYRKKDK